MVGSTFFAGVALLTLVAPFELTAPLLRLPRQSVSNLEAAVLCAFVCGAAALVWSRRLPEWRTPLTVPWIGAARSRWSSRRRSSPVSRVNAFHMTGRLAAAFGVYLLASNGVTTTARLRTVLALAVAVGVVVSVLAILEYRGVRPVLDGLKVFRPAVSTVGAQVRAGGPLQYPTIASMYLEVVFAFGLGVMLAELDGGAPRRASALVFVALVLDRRSDHADVHARRADHDGDEPAAGRRRPAGRSDRTRQPALLAGLAVVIVLLFVGSRSAESVWLRLTSEGRSRGIARPSTRRRSWRLPTGQRRPVPITVTNTGRLPWDSRGDAADAAVVSLARRRRRSLRRVRGRADAVCRRRSLPDATVDGRRAGARAAAARSLPARVGPRAGRAPVVQHRAGRDPDDVARDGDRGSLRRTDA